MKKKLLNWRSHLIASTINQFAAATPRFPFWIGLCVGVATCGLWKVMDVNRNTAILGEIIQEVEQAKQEIGYGLNNRLQMLEYLSTSWEYWGEENREDWKLDTNLHTSQSPGYQALALVDPSWQVQWIVPSKTIEEQKNLERELQQQRTLLLKSTQTREKRSVGITPFFNQANGDKGFLIYVPVYRGEKFDGWILGAIHAEQFFNKILNQNPILDTGFGLAISDNQHKAYSRDATNSPYQTRWSQERKITLNGVTWNVRVWLNSQALEKERSPLPEVVLGVGFLSALLLALTIASAQKAFLKAKQLKVINHELKQAQQLLQRQNLELEIRVQKRTAELIYTNMKLRVEIAERKQVEKALRQSQQQIQAILDKSSAVIYLKDTQGRYLQVNEEYERLTNLAKEHTIGNTDYDLFPRHITETFWVHDQKVLDTGTPLQFEEVIPLSDGNHTYISVKFPLYNSDGVLYGVCSISTDISDRKRAEEEVLKVLARERELSELKSRIITTISHEYRTPLTIILSSAELLQQFWQKLPEEKKLKQLAHIQNSARHMTNLIDDVMFINQAEIDQLTFHPSEVNLRQFCQELVEHNSCGVPSNITIDFSIYGNCEKAYLDDNLIRQIIINLFSNAIKYSPTGGTIKFRIDCHDGIAQFLIQDEGIGIPESEMSQIFDFFYRATNVGNISGTGLGLAVVKKCVDLHQGSISVESIVNQGTTFSVTLPFKSCHRFCS
jgi:PAS domain S-box-containing protein